MNNAEQTQILFDELTVHAEAITAVTRTGDHHWVLSCVDTQMEVSAELRNDDQLLTLCCPFSPPEIEQQAATYGLMLRMNRAARENLGLRLGLNESGTPIQEMDIHLMDINLQQFREYVEFFVTRAAFWTILVAKGGVGETMDTQEITNRLVDPSMFA